MTASSSITWSSNRRISSFWRRWLLWSPAEPAGRHTHQHGSVDCFHSQVFPTSMLWSLSGYRSQHVGAPPAAAVNNVWVPAGVPSSGTSVRLQAGHHLETPCGCAASRCRCKGTKCRLAVEHQDASQEVPASAPVFLAEMTLIGATLPASSAAAQQQQGLRGPDCAAQSAQSLLNIAHLLWQLKKEPQYAADSCLASKRRLCTAYLLWQPCLVS